MRSFQPSFLSFYCYTGSVFMKQAPEKSKPKPFALFLPFLPCHGVPLPFRMVLLYYIMGNQRVSTRDKPYVRPFGRRPRRCVHQKKPFSFPASFSASPMGVGTTRFRPMRSAFLHAKGAAKPPPHIHSLGIVSSASRTPSSAPPYTSTKRRPKRVANPYLSVSTRPLR